MCESLNDARRIRVLFVDDEVETIRRYIDRYRGATTDGAIVYDGFIIVFEYEATLDTAYDLLRFERTSIDAVILDVIFPEEGRRNGLWLLKRVVEMSPDLAVIVLTQFPHPAAAHQAGLLRADRFLGKSEFLQDDDPDEIELLLSEIIHLVDTKNQQPELHDRRHHEEANVYADEGYDEGEQKYPATVAYYLFENEIIVDLVRAVLRKNGRADICDIGCGTGRIEEMLAREFKLDGGELHIEAVDFAGRMLGILQSKAIYPEGDRFRLSRGSAERLALFPDASFDLVLLAFGIPSYTRYQLSLGEAARVCRRGGRALFAVYNEESVIYEAQAKLSWGESEQPVAAIADRETGKLKVGGVKEFSCETFTVDSFRRLVQRNGFRPEYVETFPTLHVALPRSEIEAMPDSKEFMPEFPHCPFFSKKLYELDRNFSRASSGRGHYIVVTACREA
ncbi:MAG: methyltransferase domain-containing protein [Deltaproteobacteria bacterium]|nr:methyltransferase domain-containing protein [Deltaproteobacteria bacterium]